MNSTIRAAVVAVVTIAALSACGNSTEPQAQVTVTVTPSATPTPDLLACRAAIGSDYTTGWDNPNGDPYPPATREPVCSGIDRVTLKRLMDEALEDTVNGTPGPG